MKTSELIKKSLLLTAVVSVSLLNSCRKDPGTDIVPVLEIPTAEILVSKLGLDYAGSVPSFAIESNIYWTVSMETMPAFESGEPEWIRLSVRGGNGSSTISLSVTPNDTEDIRTASIVVSTQGGLKKTIHLLQMNNEETVAFYTDDFGSSADNVPVGSFTGWNYSGVGVNSSKGGIPFSYEGTAVVDKSNASSDYDGASGGNNILLSGAEADFIMKNIRPLGMVNMDISFGSSTTAAAFDASELILEISSDAKNWYDIPYDRSNAAGWEYSTFSLTLIEPYAYIYLRFRTAAGEYMVDDVAVTYGAGGGVYELTDIVPPLPEPYRGAVFPVKWIMNGDSQTGLWTQTFNKDHYPPYVLSNQKGNTNPDLLGPSTLSYVYGQNLPAGWVYPETGFDIGLTGGQTFVSYPWIGDYWLFSLPVASLDAGTIVSVTFATRSSNSGHKYFMLEYMDGDEWLPASEVFKAEEDASYSYTHMMVKEGNSMVVSEKFALENAIKEDTLRVRYRCSSVYRVNNTSPMTTPLGNTHRIGFMGDVQPTIDIIGPEDRPEVVTFTLTGVSNNNILGKIINLPAVSASHTFTVKADWDWTLSTSNLDWATVSPEKGKMDKPVSITIDAQNNTGMMRYGLITLTSGNTTERIVIAQDKPGGVADKITVTGASGDKVSLPAGSLSPVTLSVNATADWTITPTDGDTWYSVSPLSGAADTDVAVTLTPKANYGTVRLGSFTIMAGTGSKIITVEQAAFTGSILGRWMMPAKSFTDGVSGDGLVNLNEHEWWYKSEEGNNAVIRAYRADGHTDAGVQVTMSYTTSNPTDGDRLLMYGMKPGDYWQIEVPTAALAAGSKLRLVGEMQSSGSGPRDFLIECSTDKNAWIPVNAIADNNTVDGDYTYTVRMGNAVKTPIMQEFTVPAAIPAGMLYIRLTVASNIRASGGTSLVGGGGTCRVCRPRYATESDKEPVMMVVKL